MRILGSQLGRAHCLEITTFEAHAFSSVGVDDVLILSANKLDKRVGKILTTNVNSYPRPETMTLPWPESKILLGAVSSVITALAVERPGREESLAKLILDTDTSMTGSGIEIDIGHRVRGTSSPVEAAKLVIQDIVSQDIR